MNEMTTTNIMVMLHRQAADQFRPDNHTNKQMSLNETCHRQCDELIEWVAKQGLSTHLMCVGSPIGKNLLRLEGTHLLAAALKRAPQILCVALVGDFEVTVLDA